MLSLLRPVIESRLLPAVDAVKVVQPTQDIIPDFDFPRDI